MKRALVILSPVLFILFVACGGGSEDPQFPPEVKLTEDIVEANNKLAQALDHCSGVAVGMAQTMLQQGPRSTTPRDTTSCYDELKIAVLLWKSARKADNSLAINDPRVQMYLAGKVKAAVNRVGANFPPQIAMQLSNQFAEGYHGYFMPRLKGSLGPEQYRTLSSSIM